MANGSRRLNLEEGIEKCQECGGTRIEYKGVGEYKCEDCGLLMYNDYGKVRLYLEENPGATVVETSMETGVSKSKIRSLLIDSRIQIAPNSNIFLRCERCGVKINSGRYCEKCETAIAAGAAKEVHRSGVKGGFAHVRDKDATGAKRYERR